MRQIGKSWKAMAGSTGAQALPEFPSIGPWISSWIRVGRSVPMKIVNRRLGIFGSVILFAIALGNSANAQATSMGILDDVGIDQALNAQLPLDVPLRDETGKDIVLRDYFGEKPVILAFVYYECPNLCTLTLNGLVRDLRAIPFDAGNQFNIVTISFDPREIPDLAAKKKQTYSEEYRRPGAAAGWDFLTGSQAAIEALTTAAGFHYKYDPESQQWAHASAIMVVTPQG